MSRSDIDSFKYHTKLGSWWTEASADQTRPTISGAENIEIFNRNSSSNLGDEIYRWEEMTFPLDIHFMHAV
jgi:hypothetical protein